ncbi:MAG: cob(I)yrinic acid a,c-diamide adenosyltransferase [Spirochaeta sp.]
MTGFFDRFLARRRGQGMPVVTTKGGDTGKSSLYSGEFLPKSDRHFEVIGDIDELSSLLGVARYQPAATHPGISKEILHIQQLLQHAMAITATRPDSELYQMLTKINEKDITWIEGRQTHYAARTVIEPRFVLPGEKSETSAWLDYCRSVTRRCERRIVGFIHDEPNLHHEDLYCTQRFFNRLSDYLFVLARYIETGR